jgi:uncharacterized protein (TIGR00369 family)
VRCRRSTFAILGSDVSDGRERFALAELFGSARGEMVGHIPHCRRLGMTVEEVGPRIARVRLPYRDELVGDPVRRVVFGGVITTLLDHASGLAVFCSLTELRTIATLDLRIDYLRAAEPGCDLMGEAQCYKLTTHVAFVRAIAWEHEPADPFASCLATFMVGANPSESAMARALRSRARDAS